jgi:predicted amidophosphoribosyltransferase
VDYNEAPIPNNGMAEGGNDIKALLSDDLPTEAFLYETLVKKRALRSRGEMSFVTLRSWNKAIREYQIKALKAIKKCSTMKLASIAARECAVEIKSLVGTGTFKFIVPVPGGHSSPSSRCLSHDMAVALGAELDLPVINAFAHMELRGSSHPKQNLKREKMKLVQDVPGPAILIDDVATSGFHLEEAAQILKSRGVETFSMAWISGDAN